MNDNRLSSDAILALLAQRHHKDVFVTECKDGPSSCTSHNRMDAWAMKRSWANPCTWGYEIKVSRRDFIGDEKWMQYLPLCNQLYFVAPPGLIRAEELGDGVGLLEVAKTGSVLRTVRKAAYRGIEPPVALYQYLLMSRTTIVAPYFAHDQVLDADFWKAWLANRNRDLDVGHRVSRKLSSMIQEKILAVESENRTLKNENKELADVKAILEQMGIHIGHWNMRDEVRKQIENVRRAVPDNVLASIQRTHNELGNLIAQLIPPTPMTRGSPNG